MFLIVGLLAPFGLVDWERVFNPSPAVWAGVGMLFVGFVIQGAAEEVLVRGFLLPIFARRYSIWASIVITSLIFAALHLLNPNLSAIGIEPVPCRHYLFALRLKRRQYLGRLWDAYDLELDDGACFRL